jgi:hypothetical protein
VTADRATQLNHLRRLATALAGDDVTAEVNATTSGPYLRVAIAATPAVCERVYCDRTDDGVWRFSWQRDEAIGSAWELPAVVARIAAVLRTPDPATAR